MSIFYGKSLKIEIFGASHADEIGIKVAGLPKGIPVDFDALSSFMRRRSPGTDSLTSARHEADVPFFLSGIKNAVTTGSELCAIIKNTDVRRQDYVNLKCIPRPGHADYCAWKKYGLDYDMSGGGVFSGRMTAPLCVLGFIVIEELKRRGITISASAVSSHKGIELRDEAELAKAIGDSVGALVNCKVEGLPIGLGGELFDGIDAAISRLLFAIPGVKGIEFGAGFAASGMYGSENNDEYEVCGNKIKFLSNNAGGVLGGMTSGEPLEFTVAFKPTPSIAKTQKSVDLKSGENTLISVTGRHDPCFALRTPPVVESAAAIALFDVMLTEEKTADLSDYRAQIDRIDGRIIDLLNERLAVCESIAAYKKQYSLPISDSAREEQKLASTPAEYREIFKQIMKNSREYQEKMQNE